MSNGEYAGLPSENSGAELDFAIGGESATRSFGNQASGSNITASGIEFFVLFATCLLYLSAYWLTSILGLPDDSFGRAEILFSSYVAFNCGAAYLAWKGLRWIPTRGLVHDTAAFVSAALFCAAIANLTDLGLWLGLGKTLKDSNIPHLFFLIAIILGTIGMFKAARLWHVSFGVKAAVIYTGVLSLFGLITYFSGISATGPDLLARGNARDVVSGMMYAILNSFIATLAVSNWIHSRGRLSRGIRLVSVGTFLLSLGCIFFAIVSARYPVYSAASHPVHLLLAVAYILIGLGVYRVGLTVVDTVDSMDDTLPPVSPLIDLFGENAGWKLYNRVLTRIKTSEKQLTRSLRENEAKAESIQALENTLETEAQIREELRQAKERAEAANSAKTHFLTMMSHELRTPLTSILGYSTLLANPPADNFDSKDFGNRIRTSAHHLQQLIDSILDFSNIEGGRVRLQPTTFPLEEILAFARSIGETQAKSRRLTFTCVAPAQPVMMTSDSLMLRQILTNLLANSFKFTDAGEVRLEVHANDASVNFRVTDSGVGIPESEIDHIFEPFFQISRGKTRNYGGVGLGLAIVKRLSELLGGKIALCSSPNKGTSIEILFPREFR